MIAVDTNILVRYVTNDDPIQAAQAVTLLGREEEIFIPKTVFLELEWVLRAVDQLTPEVIAKAMRQVLGLPNVVPEDPEPLSVALVYFEQGMDFADALHLTSSLQAQTMYTFDGTFAKQATRLQAPVVRLR